MFGIGSTELLVILVVALIVLGPKSIPQIAKTLGKVMGDFRRVSTDFQRTMNAEMEQEEHEKRKKEAAEELFGDKKNAPSAPQAASPQPPVAPAPQSAEASPPAAPVAEVVAETVQTPLPNIAPDSPLAQAVAKAEAEAATAPPAATGNSGTGAKA